MLGKKKKIKWALKLTEVIVEFYITDNDRTRFWHLLTCHIVMHSLLTHVHFFVSFELAATMFPKVPALITGCLHLQIHYGTIRCYLQPSARGREGSFWLLRGRGKRPDEQVQCVERSHASLLACSVALTDTNHSLPRGHSSLLPC